MVVVRAGGRRRGNDGGDDDAPLRRVRRMRAQVTTPTRTTH
jgi:hypothetical protein